MAFVTFLVPFQKIVSFQNFGGPFLPSQGAVATGTEKSIHGRQSLSFEARRRVLILEVRSLID